MSQRNCLSAVVSLSFLLAISGCQKPTDQSSTSDSANSSASTETSNASHGNAMSGSSGKSTAGEAAARALVVPAEATITVVLDEALGSKTSTTGQNFSASVSAPVEVDGRVAIPKGARATGIIRDAKSAGRFKGGAVLSVSLTNVTVENTSYDLRTSDHTLTSKGKGKRSAALIGGGGGAGALIGGLAGGGKGAAIGAIVGAGAGAGGAAFTGNREIVVPAETALTFKLLDPVEIKSKR